jgi:hypothetical protein
MGYLLISLVFHQRSGNETLQQPLRDPATRTFSGHCSWNPVLEVAIDLRRGSFPDRVNPETQGGITVAILTTATFAATTVVPLSVHFGRNGATEAHGEGHIKDVNQDGFRPQETDIPCGEPAAP